MGGLIGWRERVKAMVGGKRWSKGWIIIIIIIIIFV